MPRTRLSSPRRSADVPQEGQPILIAEAARRCGWRRANTFRERFLATEDAAAAMGLTYDEEGRAWVDSAAVAEAVREVETERAARDPNWRVQNLGAHARRRPPQRAKGSA
jgi:hypothetical protein